MTERLNAARHVTYFKAVTGAFEYITSCHMLVLLPVEGLQGKSSL